MPKFADVTVKWNSQKKRVEVFPETVQVYHNHPPGPKWVKWIVESMPRKATRIEIKWDTESPLLHMGAQVCNKKFCLVATGNRCREGMFKYSISFLDDQDEVIAIADPWVKDDPKPPIPPKG